jgi:hypothetical protein
MLSAKLTKLLIGAALICAASTAFAQSRGWSPQRETPYTRMAQARAAEASAQVEPEPTSPAARRTAKSAPQQHRSGSAVSQGKAVRNQQPIQRQAYAEELPLEPQPQYDEMVPNFSPVDNGCCEEYWGNECCEPCTRFWGRAEYLLYWTKGMDIPALATTSPDGTDIEDAGVLGIPGTRVLFGNSALNNDVTSGGRFYLGGWLDNTQSEGVEFNYMTLGKQTDRFSASGDQYEILARPFYNADTFAQDALLLNYPDLADGNMNVVATTSFQSFEVLFRYVAKQNCRCRTDLFLGYRYGDLRDHLRINSGLTDVEDLTTVALFDEFNTRNTFNGVDLGITHQWATNSCWTIEASARVALGTTVNRVGINGETTITTVGADSDTFAGGLLAQPTNIGSFSQTNFGSMGEFGVSGRRKIVGGLTAIVGYRFLYWADVARAGKQIDTRVNPTQLNGGELDGPAVPAFSFKNETFWAQGFNFGLEYVF